MAPRREKSASFDAAGVAKFIDLMRKYPIPSGRTSKVEVSETWKLLEREMGIPKTFLMTKWRNLVTAYRRELRLEMKAGSRSRCESACNGSNENNCSTFVRVSLEKKEVKQEPDRALGRVEDPKISIPKADVTIRNGELSMSDPVYDFLMTRIHPYVVAMPTENRMEVLEKMQQLVFDVYQRRGNKVHESANMGRRCNESIFLDASTNNGHNERL
ncbi:hypothetical protein ZHAS_00017465 [Anopheles sinensis]|uniref:MADF domain-containing protein n=1 Tax=Anopheles sinensis TaxID=74873 RepID=A0A084WGM4_ANOSI|nr:hypothetical protein ZHAS_00017465 [Anopheles sinensis]